MSRIQKGMNVHFHLGRLGKILVIDEQEQFALVESYNSHEQYAVPLEEIKEVEAQLPLSLESSRYWQWIWKDFREDQKKSPEALFYYLCNVAI